MCWPSWERWAGATRGHIPKLPQAIQLCWARSVRGGLGGDRLPMLVTSPRTKWSGPYPTGPECYTVRGVRFGLTLSVFVTRKDYFFPATDIESAVCSRWGVIDRGLVFNSNWV